MVYSTFMPGTVALGDAAPGTTAFTPGIFLMASRSSSLTLIGSAPSWLSRKKLIFSTVRGTKFLSPVGLPVWVSRTALRTRAVSGRTLASWVRIAVETRPGAVARSEASARCWARMLPFL